MSKNINLLVLFSQVYVTQILQGEELQKSRGQDILQAIIF